MTGETALSLSGLKKRYGSAVALDGVSLEVRRGDLYGFLGRNGAGKSTTIKVLAGLVRPDSGEVSMFEGADPSIDHHARKKMGFLIENPCFHPHLNAEENLFCHWLLLGGEKKQGKAEIRRYLEDVGLEGAAQRKVGGYSTGMRQRLGIAQAFLGDPEVIVLDEPMNGLDPEGIIHIREMIRARAAEQGTTFFISSHILAEVELLCTRVGFVDEGKTVAQGTLEELGSTGRLHVKVSDPAAALDAVSSRWPDAELLSKGITVNVEDADVPALVRLLVEKGHDLFEITRRARSLEEIFMELTRRRP